MINNVVEIIKTFAQYPDAAFGFCIFFICAMTCTGIALSAIIRATRGLK